MTNLRLCITVFVLGLSLNLAAQDDVQDSLERDYASELPRIAPTEPGDTASTFTIQPGFDMQLVAAEPLVHDPIAMAFDEQGRMFVVEMRGYSERRDENIGAIRLLTDTDQDGVYDKSDVYVDGLAWPTAVACYDGGVYVGIPPAIWYFKDTDGDNQADIREKVYEGFGLSNVQGLLNSFKWGMDGRIHGATSSSGGIITRADDPTAKPVPIGGRDFSFDPATRDFRAESGGGQHGLTFDLDGTKFICHNSDHIMQVMYEDRYIARNPYLAAPRARLSIATDGAQADVYRMSPVEPWRIVRTRLRVKGIVRGPVEGGGTASGYFTSATGITVYKGDAWPDEHRGRVIVADVGSNLIHRKTLTPNGIPYKADRIDSESEFIASTDNWFRPVQFANGPDGALYVADMYREVIEHPDSLPPLIKKHLDLNAGFDRGRIYRIVPEEFSHRAAPDLSKASDTELAALLEHPNAWHHETAARLLIQRESNVNLDDSFDDAHAEVRRLNLLSALGRLDSDAVEIALAHDSAVVRQHAVRLAENFISTSTEVRLAVKTLAKDEDARVRVQVAYALGETTPPADAVLTLLESDGDDEWMRLALLSSLATGADDVLAALLNSELEQDREGLAFISQLARTVGASGRAEDIRTVVAAVESASIEQRRVVQTVVRQLLNGLNEGTASPETREVLLGSETVRTSVQQHIETSMNLLRDDSKDAQDHIYAASAIGLAPYAESRELLLSTITKHNDSKVRLAALKTLRGYTEPEVANDVLEAWSTFTIPLRREALELLFSRPDWIGSVLDAVDAETFAKSNIVSTRVAQLRAHPESDIRERSDALFSKPSPDYIEEVIEEYQSALELEGDAARGRALFQEHCASCHRYDGLGYQLGPDLSTMVNRGAESILVNVIDPNREINPQYVNFTVETNDGQILSGLLDSETSTSVTLKRANGAEDTLLRVNMRDMYSSDLSIMPEDLQVGFGEQGMADLIAFLMKDE